MGKSGRKILVIEDDEYIRASLQELLSLEGYEVHCAENGQRGLDALSQFKIYPPSLILLDLTMPVMNGLEFLRVQKNNPDWKSIPVAVFSAAGGSAKPELADAFVKKPIDLDELLSLIEGFCAAPRPFVLPAAPSA